MTDWRDIHGDQNLRMANKMLEQQGEINRLAAALAAVEQDRDRLLSVLRELCDSGDATGRLIHPGQLRDLIRPYLPADEAAEPSGTEASLDPNAPPIESVLHAIGDVVLPPPGSTRCPLCGDLPIGHEGECEP